MILFAREKNMSTALALAKTTASKRLRPRRASSRVRQDRGKTMTMSGAKTTRAPRARNAAARRADWARGLVTTMVFPASGCVMPFIL